MDGTHPMTGAIIRYGRYTDIPEENGFHQRREAILLHLGVRTGKERKRMNEFIYMDDKPEERICGGTRRFEMA